MSVMRAMIMMMSVMMKKIKMTFTSMLGMSVRAPVMKEHWIDCCIMSPRLSHMIIIIIIMMILTIIIIMITWS